MKCEKVGCKRPGKKMGSIGGIDLFYCEKHKDIFYNLCNEKRKARRTVRGMARWEKNAKRNSRLQI
jgi:hypothetical protein